MEDEATWALYFASVTQMQQHPGFNRPGTPHKSITECGMLADQMLKEHRRRYPCLDGSQEQ